jgi:RimJ/RimL family protein N-acetyltransferase
MNDSEVTEYLDSHGPFVLRDLQDYYSSHAATDTSMMFAIVDHRTETHVGNLKLEPIDRTLGTAVLGVLIGDKSYWGKGICSEAVRLILEYAFTELRVWEIGLGVRAEHSAAIRCYENAGLRPVDLASKRERSNGSRPDTIWLSANKDAWTSI